jgi:hypothetical protein
MSFAHLYAAWPWRAIPNCPGRFVLEGGTSTSSPQDMLGDAISIAEYRSYAAPDLILVARFDDGGLISYAKPDGRYLHTLNTTEGFERKLRALNISHPSLPHN